MHQALAVGNFERSMGGLGRPHDKRLRVLVGAAVFVPQQTILASVQIVKFWHPLRPGSALAGRPSAV
jgi:hypothetical protein